MDLVCPPPKYCTDNAVMIAWNALEKLRKDPDKYLIQPEDVLEKIEVETKTKLGEDLFDEVSSARIKCNPIEILDKEEN